MGRASRVLLNPQLTRWNERADVFLLQFIKQRQMGEYLRESGLIVDVVVTVRAYVKETEKCRLRFCLSACG